MKQEIINWLNTDRDYSTGVDLYLKYGNSPSFKKMFPNRGNRYATKLTYELSKLAGISLADYQKKFQKSGLPGVKVKPDTQTPEIILKMKSELGDLYRLRAHLHRKMAELDEGNTDELKKQRAELLENIKKLSERSDILFNAKEDFYSTGKLPSTSILEIKKPKQDPISPKKMSGEDRVKRRSNLRSSLSKDKKKAEITPDGPKKEKILKRITTKEKEIEELTALIDKE